MGGARGCSGEKPRVKISCSRYSGLSRSILISSRTTWRSFLTSSESNFGRKTRSAMMSKAMGKCSSRTLALKQICSFEVKASSIPPTESISRAIDSADPREHSTANHIVCGRTFRLQQFFRRVELAVLAGVVERRVAVRAFLPQVNFSGLEGLRVHVNADRTLLEFRQIQHLVHRLQRIHAGRMCVGHFV